MTSPRAKTSVKGLLVATAVAFVTLALFEPLLRLRYAEPIREPKPEVLAIQEHLVLDPDIGFRWRAHISPEENIVFEVNDVDFEPLATDSRGIINHPDAIAADPETDSVDIVALGDSFMEMAAPHFYQHFTANETSFRSLAIHRQAPPHYARLLERHGPELHPDIVLVGIFENDYWESGDFADWQDSGLDWFAFHSGTWCGWPLSKNPIVRTARKHAPGYVGLFHAISSRIRGERMTVSGPTERERSLVGKYVIRIVATARGLGAEPVVLLIPSRESATDHLTPEAKAYDALAARLQNLGVKYIDLRAPFREYPDPASLYYMEDAHWNDRGIGLAVEIVADSLDSLGPSSTDTD